METLFDKIQYLFMIETVNKVRIEGKCHQLIKAIYEKPTADIILNDEKVDAFHLRLGTRQTPSHHSYPTWYWRFLPS